MPDSDEVTYYTKDQVGEHNAPDDCWVSMHGKVLDLSALLTNNRGPLGELEFGASAGLGGRAEGALPLSALPFTIYR
jgi:hypothetical protein